MNELFDERAEPVLVSALNHYVYCPRRCFLAYVEHIWDENLYTIRGNVVHENVDVESSHVLVGVRYERALPIWSKRLNLVGKADLVEFHGETPYPVEYKSGRHKAFQNDYIQICAQAICLEEMLGVKVEKGAIFWHASRERKEVVFTEAMRGMVEETAVAVRKMMDERFVPPPVNDKRCRDCSLKESCLPAAIQDKGKTRRMAERLFVVE